MKIFLKNICVILLVLGVTITLENNSDGVLKGSVYNVDYVYVDLFGRTKQMNIMTSELASGKQFELPEERSPGRYRVLWERLDRIIYEDKLFPESKEVFFIIKKGQTGQIVLKPLEEE